MVIQQEEFGVYDGEKVHLYNLSNNNDMVVKVMNYGATITSITITNSDGNKKQIACGFDTFEGYHSQAYKNNAPYFGCTVGRYASRIKDGKFSVEGVDYSLACNDGPNHLHGGRKAFDKKIWKASIENILGDEVLKMSLKSPHMDEGYPGNVDVSVSFYLSDENEIHISYEATTDMATPLSLTNHTYFNLSGFKQTIEDHIAMIDAEEYLQPDETNVPLGERTKVEGSVSDLRKGRLLRDCFKELSIGFEHFYILNNPGCKLQLAATFSDLFSNTKLEIYGTDPGALFYTGSFTSNELQRSESEQYGRFKGLCFELGRYPNGPNIPGSPGAITTPDTPYKSKAVYKIITNKMST